MRALTTPRVLWRPHACSDDPTRALTGLSNSSASLRRHAVLTVGDGNLSFSLQLAEACAALDGCSASNLVATTYDTLQELQTSFPGVGATLGRLRQLGAFCFHGVDACALHSVPTSFAFDRIVWNFPHAWGEWSRACNEDHHTLLQAFFVSCTKDGKLTERGEARDPAHGIPVE